MTDPPSSSSSPTAGLGKPTEYLQFDLDALNQSAAKNPSGNVIGKLKKVDNAPQARTIVVRRTHENYSRRFPPSTRRVGARAARAVVDMLVETHRSDRSVQRYGVISSSSNAIRFRVFAHTLGVPSWREWRSKRTDRRTDRLTPRSFVFAAVQRILRHRPLPRVRTPSLPLGHARPHGRRRRGSRHGHLLGGRR